MQTKSMGATRASCCTAGWKSLARMVLTGTVRQREQKAHGEECSLLPSALALPSSASYWQSLTGIQLKRTEAGGFPASGSQGSMKGWFWGWETIITGHPFGYSASTGILLPDNSFPVDFHTGKMASGSSPTKCYFFTQWRCSQPHCISVPQQPSKPEHHCSSLWETVISSIFELSGSLFPTLLTTFYEVASCQIVRGRRRNAKCILLERNFLVTPLGSTNSNPWVKSKF